MHPILLDFGAFKIYSYGLMMVLGMASAIFWLRWLSFKRNIDGNEYAWIAFYCCIIGYIGSRVVGILVNFDYYLDHPSLLLSAQGTLVWYGGPLFGVPAAVILLRQAKINIANALDCCACAIPLGHAIGRIGCFLAGCCHGRPTSAWYGVKLNSPLVAESLRNVPIYPTQLIESFALFTLCGSLTVMYFRKIAYQRLILIYIMAYAILRYGVEFLRGDAVRGEFTEGISTSQGLALVTFTMSAAIFAYLQFQNKTGKSKATSLR